MVNISIIHHRIISPLTFYIEIILTEFLSSCFRHSPHVKAILLNTSQYGCIRLMNRKQTTFTAIIPVNHYNLIKTACEKLIFFNMSFALVSINSYIDLRNIAGYFRQ